MRATGRQQFKKFEILINLFVKTFSILGKRGNNFCLRMFRNTNGKIGILLRYIFLKNVAKNVGKNVSIHPNVFLLNVHNLSLGNNISIHPMCYIDATGGIYIGNNISIAHSSTIISSNHTWDDLTIPIKYNKEKLAPVVLDDDIWIGCGVRILAGIKISRRSVLAAGAVLTSNVEEFSLMGGVPARLIKKIGR